MRTIQRILIIVLSIALCAPAIPAQERQQDAKGGARAPQDVTIILEQQQVHFTARTAVEWMQLQVFNSSGETVFDSGAVPAGEIKWSFQNGNDEAVKSGLYAYTLTTKEVGKEAAGVRRGHLIVDRARERDGAKDRLLITSRDADTGAELSVTREEGVTVSSSSADAERTLGRSAASLKRDAGGRDLESGLKNQGDPDRNALVAGTAGKIAKFVSGSDLGDSVIAEQNGNVGIGTTTPATKLSVTTPTKSFGISHTDGNATLGTWVGAGTSGSGGWLGTLSNHNLNFFTNNGEARMTIGAAGNVGIGTSTPKRNLHVHSSSSTSPIVLSTGSGSEGPASFWLQADSGLGGQGRSFVIYDEIARQYRMVINGNGKVGLGTTTPFGEFHIAGYGPVVTLESRQNGINKMAHFQNADGNLVFKPYGFGSCCAAMVIRETTGNVGIGTSTPLEKLHVAGNFLRVDGKGNEQVYIGGDGVGNDAQLGSANPSVTDVVLWNSATNQHMKLVASSLTITGGADFSENFDVNAITTGHGTSSATAKLEAGMVVSIDPKDPGKLTLSARSYDRRVAGVISGAGGVKPGMMMSQAGTLADGQHPVALSGRVYVWADATHGAIKPGDLMTTSPTPGHAMRTSSPAKAQGAVLGKAMTGLTSGKGLVLVLVTLQ